MLHWSQCLRGGVSVGTIPARFACGQCFATGCIRQFCPSACPRRFMERTRLSFHLSFHRWMATTSCLLSVANGCTGRDVCYDNDESTLEEYEDLLINSAASCAGNETSGDRKLRWTEVSTDINNPSSRVVELVEDILTLLPADGTGLRITTIAQMVDIEAISEVCGSLVAFVKLFPHRFRCYQVEELEGSCRWYVGRAKFCDVEPSTVQNDTHGHVDGYSKKFRNISEVGYTSVKLSSFRSELSENEKRNFLAELQRSLPSDKPVAVAGLMQTLPVDLQKFIRTSGGGLVRLLKEPLAEDYLDLSADNTFVSAKGIITGCGLPTFHQSVNCSTGQPIVPLISASPDYAEDTWDVELDLDADAEEALQSDVCPDDIFDTSKVGDNSFHSDACVGTSANDAVREGTQIPSAPCRPTKTMGKIKTPPPVGNVKACTHTLQKHMSSDELLSLHTKLALLRGRRSPSQLLDLLVECIPTFYVPIKQIKITDSLARVLGPQNTIYKVIRIYSYYFDRDKSADAVRLKPELQHARLGAANGLYEIGTNSHSSVNAVPRQLKETNVTRAFPVLQPILQLKTDHTLLEQKNNRRIQRGIPGNTGTSSNEIFSVLEALPFDRYINQEEWANTTGLALSSIKMFLETHHEKHYVLTSKALDERESPLLCRLRPYWLAPGCLGELNEESSPEIALFARHLMPVWMPLGRILGKLSTPDRKLVETAGEAAGGLSSWLRNHGRVCWVDESGSKVRRYCAVEDLDDLTHVLISFLLAHTTTEHVQIQQIIQKGRAHLDTQHSSDGKQIIGITGLLYHCLSKWKTQARGINVPAAAFGEVNPGCNDLLAFLQHHKRLDVKKEGDTLSLARKSFFSK
uniref:Uncharacterized protein TCIL3000_10_11140 n=1 Tax=Trypanosoma congolense (strain IL3000) TaxID=1068625 RepID=G0UY68_TRYCI|nr:unnamed protein product [Trypanosoma congolense IL3000]